MMGCKYLRFMGFKEYYDMMAGMTMRNDTRHGMHARTDSVGFCFLPVNHLEDEWAEEFVGDERDSVLWAARFLEGIVSDDVAVLFEAVDADLVMGRGTYADPMGDGRISVTEYSTVEYDRQSMRPVWACFWPCDRRERTYREIWEA